MAHDVGGEGTVHASVQFKAHARPNDRNQRVRPVQALPAFESVRSAVQKRTVIEGREADARVNLIDAESNRAARYARAHLGFDAEKILTRREADERQGEVVIRAASFLELRGIEPGDSFATTRPCA